ncbi:VIT1/CCC1 transporter family protein [Candidatus Micrarchaeota archaeon]|nr:VIT1/CCC1 transporter family protein [Candidatus Micrarchaeota archaeon]
MDEKMMKQMIASQKNEITEYHIYSRLAGISKDNKIKKILEGIAQGEKRHYEFWKKHTGKEMQPNSFVVWKYVLFSRLFGVTFAAKIMENGERSAQSNYDAISKFVPEVKAIKKDEEAHERLLISFIEEERLQYLSSIVLGLNDALVELSGALAGLTFAIQKAEIIAVAGLITGIAASLSMASSEYLSTQAGEPETGTSDKTAFRKSPMKAAAYTGLIYLATVLLLVMPYLILNNLYLSLAVMLGTVILIIYAFTFYISVIKGTPFLKRFVKTALISLGIAAISFAIGFIVKTYLGIQI